jgi:predicted dehydrogenase
VDGLGGSYGIERLTIFRMTPEMGPPHSESLEFPDEDRSWQSELDDFVECIRDRRTPLSSIDDAMANLRIVEELYRLNDRDYHA